jgi:hypothetical protein
MSAITDWKNQLASCDEDTLRMIVLNANAALKRKRENTTDTDPLKKKKVEVIDMTVETGMKKDDVETKGKDVEKDVVPTTDVAKGTDKDSEEEDDSEEEKYLHALKEKFKKTTAETAEKYTWNEMNTAIKWAKKWNLPDTQPDVWNYEETPVMFANKIKKFVERVKKDCKRYRKKYGKPFPAGSGMYYEEGENGKKTIYEGAKGLKYEPWYEEKKKNIRIDHIASMRTCNPEYIENSPIFNNHIGTRAYITLFLERMKEVMASKHGSETRFTSLTVHEKIAVMVEAHNDYEKTDLWAGPLSVELAMEKNRNNDPVYQLTFPVKHVHRGQVTEYHLGSTVLNMMERFFDCEDRSYCATNSSYYGDSEYGIDEENQMVVGWDHEWRGRNELEYKRQE